MVSNSVLDLFEIPNKKGGDIFLKE